MCDRESCKVCTSCTSPYLQSLEDWSAQTCSSRHLLHWNISSPYPQYSQTVALHPSFPPKITDNNWDYFPTNNKNKSDEKYIIRSNSKTNKDVELRLVQIVIHPHRKSFISKQPRFFRKSKKIYNIYWKKRQNLCEKKNIPLDKKKVMALGRLLYKRYLWRNKPFLECTSFLYTSPFHEESLHPWFLKFPYVRLYYQTYMFNHQITGLYGSFTAHSTPSPFPVKFCKAWHAHHLKPILAVSMSKGMGQMYSSFMINYFLSVSVKHNLIGWNFILIFFLHFERSPIEQTRYIYKRNLQHYSGSI